MKVIVKGKNKFVPSEANISYIEKKLKKLEPYFKNTDELEATVLCKEYDSYYAIEVTIPTKNIILRAEVKEKTLLSAMDKAIDKLESQMRKHKSKIERSIKLRDGLKGHYQTQVDFELKTISPLENVKELVKEKSITLEPMDKDEAILEMEMTGHDFYIFLDKNTHKVSVVYIRDDGNYGIISTK